MRSFYGATLLKDEEGKLGALAFESKEPLVFDEGLRDLLAILVNQATVVAPQRAALPAGAPGRVPQAAAREAPPVRRRSRSASASASAAALAVALVVLFVVPWRFRVGGPGGRPARRAGPS